MRLFHFLVNDGKYKTHWKEVSGSRDKLKGLRNTTGQVRLPVGVGAVTLELRLGWETSEEGAQLWGGGQRGERMDLGVQPGLQILAGGSRVGVVCVQSLVGRPWPLTGSSRLQDSDGDKSDDLVVDVSNEVRAGPRCRAALALRRFGSVPHQVGAVMCWLLHAHCWQPEQGSEAARAGASGWLGEQGRALPHGVWACVGTEGGRHS